MTEHYFYGSHKTESLSPRTEHDELNYIDRFKKPPHCEYCGHLMITDSCRSGSIPSWISSCELCRHCGWWQQRYYEYVDFDDEDYLGSGHERKGVLKIIDTSSADTPCRELVQ